MIIWHIAYSQKILINYIVYYKRNERNVIGVTIIFLGTQNPTIHGCNVCTVCRLISHYSLPNNY